MLPGQMSAVERRENSYSVRSKDDSSVICWPFEKSYSLLINLTRVFGSSIVFAPDYTKA